jgi:hypothetical protein
MTIHCVSSRCAYTFVARVCQSDGQTVCQRTSKTMTTSIKLFMLAVLGVTAGMAAPLCVTGTYDTYVALDSFGCIEGTLLLFHFSLTPSFTNSMGVPTLANSQILITPTVSGSTESLAFSYETTTGAPMVISLNDNDQVFAFSFSYNAISVQGPGIHPAPLSSIQMTSTFSNTEPGSVSATKIATAGEGVINFPTFASAVTSNGVSNVNNTYLGPVTAVNPSGSADDFSIQDAISLQAQTGSVSDTGFANIFVTRLSADLNAPEPPASILIGGGLLLIGSLVRRVSSRKRMNA